MAKSRRPASPPFESIYRHGFARVAVATPRVEVASPGVNVAQTLDLARRAARERAVLAVFPELGLSAYSNESETFGWQKGRDLVWPTAATAEEVSTYYQRLASKRGRSSKMHPWIGDDFL